MFDLLDCLAIFDATVTIEYWPTSHINSARYICYWPYSEVNMAEYWLSSFFAYYELRRSPGPSKSKQNIG